MNTDELVNYFWREEAGEVCALPLSLLDALICRNVPKHKDSGNQDRNQAHRRPQRGGPSQSKSVHEDVAEDREERAGDAHDHDATATKVVSGNKNNNHIEGGNRKRERRPSIDEKNAARKRSRHGKGTEAGKVA